ncbi:CobW family GTP-binding protein [Fictibacillus iocasae]|uniref:CobW family GTP-binding protein n=1 Tax=Fictibacillus iocasae TaxID=2715437 RepID=A0ABW2NYZ5_9BACL
MEKAKVLILAGFLGSGKTTLLKQLLIEERRKGSRPAVLMNEIGSVSIDSDAVPGDIPLSELLNGCVCCTLQDQLERQLLLLCQQHAPETIIIEATGVAHPIDILDACLSPDLLPFIKDPLIISVIDSPRWLKRENMSIQSRMLLTEQVKHADLLLWNKTGSVTEAEREQLLEDQNRLNPKVTALFTDYAKVDNSLIRSLSSHEKGDYQTVRIGEQLKVKTFIHTFSGPVSKERFEDWLRNEAPDTIYRMKGYMQFSEKPGTVLMHYSYGLPQYEPEFMKKPLRIVIIGEELDKDELSSQLNRLVE